MIARIPAHVTNTNSQSVPHADDTDLRNGILFEEFGDEVLTIADGKQISSGPEVFLRHGSRKVDDDDQMPDDASLERRSILECPAKAMIQPGDARAGFSYSLAAADLVPHLFLLPC